MSHITVPTVERRTAYAYLTIRQVRDHDVERIHPIGEIDLCTAPVLRDALEYADLAPHVIVDLSKVKFMALVGVQVLRAAGARRAAANRRLVVIAPTMAAQRILSLADAADDLDIYLSTRSALSALHAST
jgi:anti-anti-sigma factor